MELCSGWSQDVTDGDDRVWEFSLFDGANGWVLRARIDPELDPQRMARGGGEESMLAPMQV
jgi:hypothetical protein